MRSARPGAERAARGGEQDQRARPRGAGPARPGRSRCARCRPAGARTPRARASRSTSAPAITSTSLFASATSRPARIAASVGARPDGADQRAETTRSASAGRDRDQALRRPTTISRRVGRRARSRSAPRGLGARRPRRARAGSCCTCCGELLDACGRAASATTRSAPGSASTTVERLLADAAGAAEHREALHDRPGSPPRTCALVRPKRRSRVW